MALLGGNQQVLGLYRWWKRMLSDIERKVLRIISNNELIRNRTPSIVELEIKTGRDQSGVFEVLGTLNTVGYIKWNQQAPDYIEVLERWERRKVPW
jgi:predicted transcriptional regulator